MGMGLHSVEKNLSGLGVATESVCKAALIRMPRWGMQAAGGSQGGPSPEPQAHRGQHAPRAGPGDPSEPSAPALPLPQLCRCF